MTGLTTGRIVHFAGADFAHHAAIVVCVDDAATGTVGLTVFRDSGEVVHYAGIEHDPLGQHAPLTWHWIERA
jgi:hypothetical protein